MADKFFRLQISGTGNGNDVTYGSFNVQKPQNYTNNKAFIGQHPLSAPENIETMSPQNIGAWTSNNAGQLMSCFEIDWGGAIEGWREDGIEWDARYKFPDEITTSADLLRYIFMLRWKLEHLKLVDDKFKVTANGLTATASVISGTVNLNNLQWTLSNSSTNYTNVKLNQTTGASVTLQGTIGTNTNKGTVDFTKSSYTLSGTSQTFEAKFTRNSISAQLKGTITATSPDGAIGDPNSVTLSKSAETIYGLEEATNEWTWKITGAGASLCKFSNNSTTITGDKSQTITWNSSANGEQITISISNTNGSSAKTINVNLPTQQVTYYWYVGQTNPTTMDSISPIVTDNSSPGWRKIGTTLPTYSSSNRLWSNSTNGDINMPALNYIYIAIPNTTTIPRDGLGTSNLDNGSYEKLSTTKTINNVTYTIYKSTSQWLMAFTDEIY